MASNRTGNHLTYRYGICLNDNCEKGKSKEKLQILAHKDFVCPECGKALRECPPPKPPVNWIKIIGIIIGVILVVGLVWWLIGSMSSDKDSRGNEKGVEQTTTTAGTIDSLAVEQARLDSLAKVEAEQRAADSIRAKQIQDSIKAAEAAAAEQKEKKTGETVVAEPKMPKVSFGVYTGPANGLGGEIKVTKAYTLDLRNASHEVIELLPGDVIKNVQIKNGELRSGMWQRGTQSRAFNR